VTIRVDVQLVPSDDDACVVCEQPIPSGDPCAWATTSLTPDEGVSICIRCARALGSAVAGVDTRSMRH
jgi:hypothetical protein